MGYKFSTSLLNNIFFKNYVVHFILQILISLKKLICHIWFMIPIMKLWPDLGFHMRKYATGKYACSDSDKSVIIVKMLKNRLQGTRRDENFVSVRQGRTWYLICIMHNMRKPLYLSHHGYYRFTNIFMSTISTST